MAEVVECARCLREATPIVGPTVPGALGEEIRQRICAECWAEWQKAEVMVINELRLNFMDPSAQKILEEQMKEFLGLGEGGAAPRGTVPGAPDYVPPDADDGD